MSNVFLRLLNISITAGWIVLVVVLLRFVLKKAPKWTRVVLWGLVAVRLLVPVSIESVLSLVPSAETVKIEPVTAPVLTSASDSNGSSYFYEDVQGERIVLQSGISALNSAVNPSVETAAKQFDTVAVLKSVAGWVWLGGAVAMLLYALISYLRLRHKVRASVKIERGIYVCDDISDPFILGLIRPKVYLPSGMDETTKGYVLAHEKAHLKRFDHIWKPLGFLLLSVYWFNPLLWLAYILLCRDIELACDEKVVKELDDAGKAAYSEALVTASVSRRSIAACPLAFGETGVKSRVKSVLNYKKPAFWIILVAILACVAVAVCFLTMPKKDATITELSEEIQKINGTLPGNTFLYLYRDNTSYFCYSLNGENGCGTSDAYYDKPFDLFAEIRQGIITVDHDSAHIKEITRFIHDTSIGFIQNTITGSKQYSTGLFEQVLPLYTQDWHKCREIKLKENDADFPVSKGSNAYYTLNENGFELCYYGHSDKGNDNVSSMLLYIEVPDLEAVIERFAPSAASDKTPIPTASFDSITGSDAKALQWLDFYESSNDMPWDSSKEITVAAFPGVTFRWTSGSVEAVENGTTRTLFTGMPVWNVFFTDVTGDGKPELCATVSFGSGIVDDHIVVYDYANRQSYTLWERGTYDYHLYTVDGALLVGKTLCNSYSSDRSILDTGTLTMQDGLLCCRWQSDGSFTPLYRELNESELYGGWLVREETDNDGNVLYTTSVELWKEYHFKEDGTVTYNETVPVSSNSELAFGHPVSYPYEVHDDYVYIAGDDTAGTFRWGSYDRDTRTLTLMYNTDAGTVYAKLRRMGEGTQGEAALDEATLCTIWTLVEIEASDGSNGDARALGLEQYLVFRSDGTVRIVERDGQGYAERIAPYTWNGNTVRYDDTVLRYSFEDRELVRVDAVTQNVYFYTPTPNAVLPEATPQPIPGAVSPFDQSQYHKTVPVGEVPEEFKEVVAQNLFYEAIAGKDRLLTGRALATSSHLYTYQYTLRDRYGDLLTEVSIPIDSDSLYPGPAMIVSDGGFVATIVFEDHYRSEDQYWASEKEDVISCILKYDASGKLQWKTELPNINGYALHLCIERSGAYYFFGDLETPETKRLGVASPTDLYLLMIGTDGSILKEQTYGGSDYDMIRMVDTDGDRFVIDARIQSTDGDFPAFSDWRITVDSDLAIVKKEQIENARNTSYVGTVDGKRIYTDDPRFRSYPDGYVRAILSYDTFDLIISENMTGVYENQPLYISSIWYLSETVYAAYDKQGNLLWKAAVDSSPDYDSMVKLP